MKTYKYQLHTHTAPCSACAGMTPKELIRGLLEGGYQGCVMTNHFMHGNTGIDRDLPWEEFVKQYELDYLACLDAAKGHDLDIIFGVEEVVVEGLEILCYGVTPQMLYDHPELFFVEGYSYTMYSMAGKLMSIAFSGKYTSNLCCHLSSLIYGISQISVTPSGAD